MTEKIVFCGDGTGGHIYPIISIKETLQEEQTGNLEFLYLVTTSLGQKIAQENQIRTHKIFNIKGMPRSLALIPWLVKLFFASVQALLILVREKPKLIFSTGGYGSAACLVAANLLGIRYLLHNLDSKIGLANRLFLHRASALTYGFMPAASEKKLVLPNGPVIFSGNPVRRSLQKISPEETPELSLSKDRKTLLILGGSQGAQYINQLSLKIIPQLLEEKWQVLHQLGPKQFDLFEKKFPDSSFYFPVKYFDKLEKIYPKVDVAVSRGGAMTLTELCLQEIPSIIVPLPTAAQNHQYFNALFFSQEKAAFLAKQEELNSEKLTDLIEEAYFQSASMKIKLKQIRSQILLANKLIIRLVLSSLS